MKNYTIKVMLLPVELLSVDREFLLDHKFECTNGLYILEQTYQSVNMAMAFLSRIYSHTFCSARDCPFINSYQDLFNRANAILTQGDLGFFDDLYQSNELDYARILIKIWDPDYVPERKFDIL